MDITVCPILQQNATPEDLANHIDIADWLIREMKPRNDQTSAQYSRTFLKIAKYFDPSLHAELEALIDDFGLELM